MKLKSVTNPNNAFMNKRCTIRKYQKDHKIKHDEILSIIDDALNAPSSLNLQPWRIIAIESDAAKEALLPFASFNQLQVSTCSVVLAIFADLNSFDWAEKIAEGEVALGVKESLENNKMLEIVAQVKKIKTPEQILNSHFFDCGLLTMQLTQSALGYGYASNIIGGYDKAGLSQHLNVEDSLVPIVMITIGKADEGGHQSVRLEAKEVTQII